MNEVMNGGKSWRHTETAKRLCSVGSKKNSCQFGILQMKKIPHHLICFLNQVTNLDLTAKLWCGANYDYDAEIYESSNQRCVILDEVEAKT